MRRTRTTVVVLVVLFTLVGFIGVPLLAQYVVAGRLAASLHRPVSMARVRFNPYTLRLNVNRLHIGDRETSERFVDIGHIQVKISWSSLFRLAPVVGEVAVRRPEIHIVRTADQRFNFSDLLESSGPTPAPTPAPAEPPKPQRFAVSNIQIHDGQVDFDDKVLGERHTLEHLELDVPFIANLPADVNIFVQPLLQMVVDGSPLRIGGKAKPFAVPPESEIDLNLHRLSIPLYIGYVPRKLPLKVPQGMLSSQLQVHFVNAASAPEIRIAGEVAIDELDVRDTADAPLAGFKHMSVVLTELKPLESITHLGKIYLDGLTVHVARNRDGTINLASLAGTSPAPPAAARAKPSPAAPIAAAPTPSPPSPVPPSPAAIGLVAAKPSVTQSPASAKTAAAANTPAAIATAGATPVPATNTALLTASAPPAAAQTPQPAATAKPSAPADVSLEALELTNGEVDITDNSATPPAALALKSLHVGLKDLHTVGQKTPAPFDLSTTLGGGGSIAVKGAVDLASSQVTTDVTLDAIDLPALQGFAQPFLAATVATGKLTAHANVQTLFATGRFNVHAAPANISFDKFELRDPHESVSPIGWNKLSASIGLVDLATHQATVTEVRSDGLHLFVRRERNGQLSLASLMRQTGAPEAKPTVAAHERVRSASRRRERRPPERRASEERTRERERRVTAAERRRRVSKTAARAPAPVATPAPGSWRYQVASVAIEKSDIQRRRRHDAT